MESKDSNPNIKCRSIKIYNHQVKDNKVIYTLEIKLKNKQSIIITERFSELLNLHNAMSKEAKLPKFPPKKFFGNMDENFLNKRQSELNRYYEIITSSHIYTNLSSFRSWIANKFRNIHIEDKELKYNNVVYDINLEKKRQDKIINYINMNIIPQFFESNIYLSNDESEQENNFQNKENKESKEKREKLYLNSINTELFPFVENNFMENDLTGNNKNFNFIGNKKNNLIKMERLFNNKLNELAEYSDTKCFKKFQTPDILMEFEL